MTLTLNIIGFHYLFYKPMTDLLKNVIFTELSPNKFLAVVWNTFWFCVELLLYPRFLNNGLTLQAPVIFQNNFQVGVDKIFQPNVSHLMQKMLLLLVIEQPLNNRSSQHRSNAEAAKSITYLLSWRTKVYKLSINLHF